jgi:hypothetical protein
MFYGTPTQAYVKIVLGMMTTRHVMKLMRTMRTMMLMRMMLNDRQYSIDSA